MVRSRIAEKFNQVIDLDKRIAAHVPAIAAVVGTQHYKERPFIRDAAAGVEATRNAIAYGD